MTYRCKQPQKHVDEAEGYEAEHELTRPSELASALVEHYAAEWAEELGPHVMQTGQEPATVMPESRYNLFIATGALNVIHSVSFQS
ncbi:hypothetical protein [Methyloradius palustris]|uniref:hypothetical protein n=1 Tax=Methyloradius palustris TaxID=2778876 RepID=UPI001C8C1399|nr:hypothetical protein [Methyloradius palustris]